VRKRGHDRFDPLWRALDHGLAADGWHRADQDGWDRGYARGAAEGLELSLGVYAVPREAPEFLATDLRLRHPAAQNLLKRLGSFGTAAVWGDADVDIELDGALDPDAAAHEVIAAVREGAAALLRDAGTVDAFVARVPGMPLAEEVVPAVLAVSGREDEARAAVVQADTLFARGLRAHLDGEKLPAKPWSLSAVKAKVDAEKAAAAAMEALGPYADAAARRASLEAALAEHGLEKSPYWIQLQVDRTRPPGTGLRDFVRDARRALQAIGGEPSGDDDVASGGRGPWLEVALNGDAHTTLARAFERASLRITTTATVTADLRPEAGGEAATVLLDGVAVGRLTAPIPEPTRARAQIGRLAGPDRWHLQVRLP
jgi:hypothetical protein